MGSAAPRPNWNGVQMRPTKHLAAARRIRPGLFDRSALLRAGRANWPVWCWVPVEIVQGMLAAGLAGGNTTVDPLEAPAHTAVAAWRQSQGVYRFDPDVLEALWNTPVSGDLPVELLERLPEWCVYIETPGRVAFGKGLEGFYVLLDFDPFLEVKTLRMTLDTVEGLLPIPITLGGSLGDAADRIRAVAQHALEDGTIDEENAAPGSQYHEAMEPLVSLTLYLCSEAAEISDRRNRTRTTAGFRDPDRTPNSPTVWETVSRLGARLRAARAATAPASGGSHGSPRPHVRRAHWHHYWIGSRSGDERRLVLKWIHPTLIGGDEGGLVATIHAVD